MVGWLAFVKIRSRSRAKMLVEHHFGKLDKGSIAFGGSGLRRASPAFRWRSQIAQPSDGMGGVSYA
jgi:hypothetical protein